MWDKFEFKILKYTLLLIIIGILISLCLIPLNYSYLIGWSLGSFISVTSYLLNILLLNIFFKKIKTKTLGFWVGMLRYYINLFYHASWIISIIAIDSYANNISFTNSNIDSIQWPINIYAYLASISITFLGTIISQIFTKQKKGNQ